MNVYSKALLLSIITQLAAGPAVRAQDEELDKLFDEDALDEPIGNYNQAPPPPAPPPDFSGSPGAGFPPPEEAPAPPPPSGGGTVTLPGGSNMGASPGKLKTSSAPGQKPSMATAEPEDITNENFPDLIESFDYPNAEITDIVKAISELTGKNFIIDPSVRGKISIIAPTRITVAEAYKAFLSALAINGFTIVPSGKFLKIKSARNAQRDSIETYSGSYYPNGDLMITRIIHLKHISAEEVNKRLRILPSKDGEMTPYEPTNSLIISDYGANIERIMKIINELDKAGFEEQLSVIPIRFAKAKDIADLIDKIINKGAAPGSPGGFRAGVPSFRTRGAGGTGTPEELSLVAPDDRTNSIIVVGNKAGIDKIRSLVKKLDFKLDPSEFGGVFVYYVKYGEAEKIQQTLSGLAQTTGSGASSGGAGGASSPSSPGGFKPPGERQAIFGGDVKITADKNTNSLVITASKQDYEIVLNLLGKIDIPRDQVYVEAIIMEMQTDKARNWDVSYYQFFDGKNTGGVARAGFSGGNLASLVNPMNDKGAILGFGSGERFKLKFGTTEVEIPSLLAFVNFLRTETEGNILSTPQILALDNEEAELEVGDQIPIGQETQTTAGGVQNTAPKFEKATIKLKITPFISPDSEAVRMKIDQSVKQASEAQVKAEALKNSTTVITDRSLKTNIVVGNGDTAVLGGLMRDEEVSTETKVPVLGDIPVLGWLFKSSRLQKKKLNLLIFLTPKIIRSTADSQEMLTKKVNQRIDWIKKNFDGRDPYGKNLDELPRAEVGADEKVERRKKQ